MQKEFLKEAVSIIVGKQFDRIVDFLGTEKYVNEFFIAKKLDITINQTRNLLYKLSEVGMVLSIRKKDKKKGWYTYFWKLEILKTLEFLRESIESKAKQIRQQIESRETKRFYICERCNIEFNEENALLYDFTCNECGNVFSVKDNSKLVRELRKNLEKFEKQLYELSKDINAEKEKNDKKRLKVMKKEENLKAKKREEKRLERQKERKKLKKAIAKAGKKTVKSERKKIKKAAKNKSRPERKSKTKKARKKVHGKRKR